jgi:hypothetical protein
MTEFDPDFKVDDGAIALFSQYLGFNNVDQIRHHILETTARLKTVGTHFHYFLDCFPVHKLVSFF